MEYGTQPTRRMSIGNRVGSRVTETKQAFKTTEFWVYVVIVLAVLIAGLVAEGGSEATATQEAGSDDGFGADKVWLYVTLLSIGYMISRGLAKAGSHDPYTETPGGDDSGDSLGNRVKAAAQVLKEGEPGTQTHARPDEGTHGTRGGF